MAGWAAVICGTWCADGIEMEVTGLAAGLLGVGSLNSAWGQGRGTHGDRNWCFQWG